MPRRFAVVFLPDRENAMDNNRLIEIETKLAHQEHVVEALNQTVIDQQDRISRLEALCRVLTERLQSLADGGAAGTPDDEIPPHY
jgi:SlyX protein